MQLAVVYIEQGRKDQGNRILETLGVESQQDVEVMRKVVQLYLDPQNFDQAIMVLNGMLKSVPDNADLNYLAGIAYDGKGDTDTALQHFNRVTPGSRFYENAVVQISVIYQEKGQIQKAITYIQGIIKENPDNPEFMLYLGSFYEEIEDFKAAEAALKQGLDIKPDHVKLHFRLGVVYDKWGKKEDSIRQMRLVIKLDPQNANALNYLGYTYADLGKNLDEAEKLIKEALQYKPEDGYIIDSLGWVYFKKGQYQEALIYLKKAVELVPEDPIILEHLGDVYRKLGDPDNALEFYQRSLLQKKDNREDLEKKINDILKQKKD
jgi:tetratricopeptide (TPR) repeat protein